MYTCSISEHTHTGTHTHSFLYTHARRSRSSSTNRPTIRAQATKIRAKWIRQNGINGNRSVCWFECVCVYEWVPSWVGRSVGRCFTHSNGTNTHAILLRETTRDTCHRSHHHHQHHRHESLPMPSSWSMFVLSRYLHSYHIMNWWITNLMHADSCTAIDCVCVVRVSV